MLSELQNPRASVVLTGAVAAAVGWFVAFLVVGNAAAVLPAGALIVLAGGFVFWQAVLRKPWALLGILAGVTFLCSVVFRSRDMGDPGLDFQNGIKVAAWAGMAAVALLNAPRLAKTFADPAMMALGFYCAVCLVSGLYSPLPLLTTTSAIGIASYVAFGSLLAREVPQRTICLVLLWTFAAFCVVNVVSALVVPDVAYFQVDPIGEPGKTRFQGISGHPNQLGEIATIFGLTTIAAAWWRYAKPVVWVPSLLLALGLIIVSGSRTSLLSLVLSLGLQMPRRYLLPIGAVVIILGGGIVLSGHLDTLMGLVGRNGDAAEAMTMSGRTELWDFSSSLISARPLVGYGFNTFEAYAGTLWTGNANAAVVATHNNLLSVLYSTGIFGAIPFVTGFAILVYRWAVRPSFVRDLFVINAILTSFSEADVLSLIAPVPTLIFIIFVALDVTKDISGRTT